ncbi:hemerythrin domain-containing protein [Glycomyces buryatensis]|uniref:Hemerythrin-like domain-containing protein n=1 Tax=Glycomyces buryatensis TaxID=2570927 RepID=A0A4S8PQJ5_9ACTN|nr:hemerythrin domain-containing protein [Glycomyces buryatensis]THV33413.1 hypothetical protein FAB82_25025 [Glycomyces buryatensis]
MSSESNRIVAFSTQLREVHHRLRAAMDLARSSIDGDIEVPEGQDLLVFYRGFCAAISGHHSSEDKGLFPHAETPKAVAPMASHRARGNIAITMS